MPLGTNYAQQDCTLARALEIVGERWTMLVLRDCFYGVRRFTHLLEHLDISRAVLTDRLASLVEAGVLERRMEDGQPAYVLTEAGVAFWPGLYALMRWGERFGGPGQGSRVFEHEACGTAIDDRGACPRCGVVPGPADLVRNPVGDPDPGAAERSDPVSVRLREPHRLLTPLLP
jgi:DNA-binding HxlR family transcriptional regulator